ncbi:kelch-like protein 8 [Zootermopsis nevadensis]|uniref:kelch-like protein 8 n=1 Tax=Zootermopsis nevadensis TaxID=136037 RepID=UPI000B8E3932|nr:kelch-like protein 8 [Zootermopsis nevadensis]
MESNQSRSCFQVGSRGMRTEASVPLKELRGKNLLCDESEMVTKKDKELVTPSIPQDILFAIGGFRDGNPSDVIEAYDAQTDRWSVVEGVDSIGPRMDHGTAVVGFDIYVIGGYRGIEYLCSCCCFNAVTKTCREVAPMNCTTYIQEDFCDNVGLKNTTCLLIHLNYDLTMTSEQLRSARGNAS